MKVWHWVVLFLALVGAIYFYHNYQSHGGTAGIKQGLGFGGNAA